MTDMEAVSKMEAMELARHAAEERARQDEQAWRDEEKRLEEEEAWRRQERAAREVEEKRQDAAVLEAERLALALDESDIESDSGGGVLGTTTSSTFADLLDLEGNRSCFDCDAELSEAMLDASSGKGEALWWSVTHGTLLCASCALSHDSLGPQTSVVRPADSSQSAAMLPELDVLYAGGNGAFAAFLAEEGINVPRRVWLALPIDARYHTPAADLYQRRLRALVDGEMALPSELQRVLPPPPSQPMHGASPPADRRPSPADRKASSTVRAPPPPSTQSRAPPPARAPIGSRAPLVEPTSAPRPSPGWSRPDTDRGDAEEEVTMTDFLTKMTDMRARIEAAKHEHRESH